MKIGDIVIFKYNFKNPESNEVYKYIMCPDLLCSNFIVGVPLKLSSSHIGKYVFKLSHFKVETPQSYFYQNQYDKGKADPKNVNIEDLKKLAEEEKRRNKTEYNMNNGNEIIYGNLVQFRNIFTNEILSVVLDNISKEIGCFEVSLSKNGGENSVFKILPADKIRNEGNIISISDNVYIVPSFLDFDSFLHVNLNYENFNETDKLEVNISNKKTPINFNLVESVDIDDKVITNPINQNIPYLNSLMVRSTEVIQIFFYESGGFLSINKKYVKNFLHQLSNENNDDEDFLISTKIIETQQKMENYFLLIEMDLDKLEESNTHWEFIYYKYNKAKEIECCDLVRIRHVATGLFVSHSTNSNDLFLIDNFHENSTLFTIYSNTAEENLNKIKVTTLSHLNIMTLTTKKYLIADSFKNRDGKIPITLSDNKFDLHNRVFKIKKVDNNLSFLNITNSLARDNLISIFNKSNLSNEINRESEITLNNKFDGLEVHLNTYLKILNALKEVIEITIDNSISMNTIQKFFSEQCFLSLFLYFIKLFHSKVLDYKKSGNKRIHFNNDRLLEKTIFTQCIKETFEILNLLILDNKINCKLICKDINLLKNQFNFYKIQIMRILIKCLELGAQEFINIDVIYTKIDFWRDKIACISEKDNNVEEQTFLFKILSLLCVNDKKEGIYKTQIEIKLKIIDNLFPLKFILENDIVIVKFNLLRKGK